MGNYSINDIERLTGIKSHTIRIWEKRYEVFQPERTDTNIRFYTDDTLRKILKINILYNNGLKISKIAKLSDSQINNEVKGVTLKRNNVGFENQIDALVVTMIELNEDEFNDIFANLLIDHSFEDVVLKVCYPLFEKVGVLWQIGTIDPAQEHFLSNLLRQKILVAIDGITLEKPKKTYLLYLRENELHELGLLFFNYLLRKQNHKVVYIGQSLPYNDLLKLKKTLKFDCIVTSFVSAFPVGEFQAYLNKLNDDFPTKEIIMSGYQINDIEIKLPSRFIKVNNAEDFKSQISNH